MHKLKIALLSYRSAPFSGGQGIFVKELSNALSKRGHEIDIISGPPMPILDPGIKLIKLEGLNLFETFSFRDRALKLWNKKNKDILDYYDFFKTLIGGFPEMYTFGERVKKYLSQKKDYDIVIDNQSLSSGILEIQKNYPFVEIIHHPITKDFKYDLIYSNGFMQRFFKKRWYSFLKMNKTVAPNLKKVITPSFNSKKDIALDFNIDPNKIAVIPNGLDLTVFKKNNELERERFKIVTVASADIPLKGLDTTLTAISLILDKYPNIKLSVVGNPRENGHTERIIRQLNLSNHVSFKTNLSKEEVAYEYQSSSLAVISSLYEGFGFPAAEAMACGTPIISSNSSALPEIVQDFGQLYEPGNSDALKDCIENFYLNRSAFNDLAKKGSAYANETFNWQKIALDYEEQFLETIEKFNSC
ncbi:glycosyltransferase family 4 protein [Pseudomonadota bacterium]|nr:glycosyltransferase family 4 protein [Pseudomonadota bacterium]